MLGIKGREKDISARSWNTPVMARLCFQLFLSASFSYGGVTINKPNRLVNSCWNPNICTNIFVAMNMQISSSLRCPSKKLNLNHNLDRPTKINMLCSKMFGERDAFKPKRCEVWVYSTWNGFTVLWVSSTCFLSTPLSKLCADWRSDWQTAAEEKNAWFFPPRDKNELIMVRMTINWLLIRSGPVCQTNLTKKYHVFRSSILRYLVAEMQLSDDYYSFFQHSQQSMNQLLIFSLMNRWKVIKYIQVLKNEPKGKEKCACDMIQ